MRHKIRKRFTILLSALLASFIALSSSYAQFGPPPGGGGAPPPPPPPPPPQNPVVGDIIYDKDNDSYGIVKSIDDSSGELEYDPIPQSKVKEYLKRKESGENILGDDIGKELDF